MADIQVTITPSNATDKTFTVESDHPEIVSVDGTTCTAVSAGTAVLTIKTTDGNKTATCTVTAVSVNSVSVDPSTKEVTVGDSFTVGEA